MATVWERIGQRLTLRPAIAFGFAAAMLVVSLGLAVVNERMARSQTAQQAQVQAEILAASVAAPLAFDDSAAIREYLDALRANPAIQAAAAYGADGQVAASFNRNGPAPPSISGAAPTHVPNHALIVRAPVVQGTTQLGSVYLRLAVESAARRATRYVGIGIVLVMASMIVAVLGAAGASLREAHARLKAEVDEREKAEAALRQAQKMEAMGQLTGGVAHDFNNLLMVASSGLDLMDRTSDPARRERLKSSIRQAIDRGADLTQQLLAFSRKAPLKSQVVDLAAVLAGMRDVLDRSLREDIAVRVESPPGLWPVEIDPSQFEVAVLNVAINARDAMPDGGIITVRLRNLPAADDGAERVSVAISDTGAGMSPEQAARVFEPFFTTKEVGKGTGLGLSQVYGFINASGGEVRFESQPGLGATVTMLLPRSTSALASAALDPAQIAPLADDARRLLYVEDDDRVALLVVEMLGELGYRVTRAVNAAAALETLATGAGFDLVFSDMVMPGELSGLDLAHILSRDRPDLAVVLTTGYSASAAAATAENIHLLVKPYRIETLAAELQAALGEHRAGRSL
jgi:signal transduction histidine kinase/ActR/RegA family two-component response regulator